MGNDNSLGRGVAMILVAGIALGLTHNWVGLASHPPRGIPWRASRVSLPKLESFAPRDTAARVDRREAVPANPGNPAPQAAPARPRGPSAAIPAVPKTHAAEPRAPAPTPPGQPAESTSRAEPPPAKGSADRLPSVPEMDRPVETQLATVKLFFDAGAALFLDARDPSDYEAGHIPGAIRMTQSDALSEPESLKTLPVRGRPIIAYCEGGECEASLELARALVDSGFRRVLVYTGGFPEWAAAGYPVERGKGGR